MIMVEHEDSVYVIFSNLFHVFLEDIHGFESCT